MREILFLILILDHIEYCTTLFKTIPNVDMTGGKLPSAELLDDICVRFILTLPATELE